MPYSRRFAIFAFCYLHALAHAAPDTPVIAAGTVPDAASKAAILGRLQALFGAARVVDRIGVGGVIAPPGWEKQVQSALSDSLRQVSEGTLQFEGSAIRLQGGVGSVQERQAVLADLSGRIDPTYTLRNELRINAPEQGMVDAALGKRIVEFELGKADLTARGRAILDDIAGVLLKLQGKRVEVVGHTDDRGARWANVALSLARAEAVKTYLTGKGIPAASISVSGKGPDQPVADNAVEDGRARNRRIEFRVL